MANEDKRIIELPASTSILNDDWIAKDSASQDTTRLQLSFLKQLCGGNNFAGEWHSGTTYSKDSYVTREGKLYHNITGSATSTTWKASQWQEIDVSSELKKVVGSLAPTFDTSTNYKVDDLVIYDNTLYRCIAAHTAGTWVGSHFGTVKVSSLLTYFIMDNFTEIYWEDYYGSPVNYTKGTVIHKGLKLYRCKADTTNQSWDSSKWEQVDVTDLLATEHGYIQSLFSIIAPTFSSLAQYNINDFVIYNNELYICMKPHHGSWDPLDFGTGKIGDILKGIFNNIADVYNPSGSYVKGDVVNYVGIPLRCIVDTATSPMVFSEWERVTVEQLIDEKVADVQIAGQTTADENKISDLTSLAIEGTASGEIASFSDGSNLPMRSFVANIDAVQDLHGYDYPWVGGAGKNKLNISVENAQVRSTDGTWNGDVYTYRGVTFAFAKDNSGNVISITANGTPTGGNAILKIDVSLDSASYRINGCSGGSQTTYQFQLCKNDGSAVLNNYNGEEGITSEQATNTKQIQIIIRQGYTANNLVFNPMIRLATETDPTFAPYENICPISGHTGLDAWVRGKNLLNQLANGSDTSGGVTFEKDGCGGVNISGTSTSIYPQSALQNLVGGNKQIVPVGATVTLSVTAENVPSGAKVYAIWYERETVDTAVNIYSHSTKSTGKVSFTTSEPYTNLIIVAEGNGITYTNTKAYVQLELGEIATSYEPYNLNSQTIQVSWQTAAGEVFDGYVDLVSGELTVTHKSQTGFTRGSQDSTNKLYNIGAISDIKVFNDRGNISPYFIDSMFEKMSVTGARAAETPSIAQLGSTLYVSGYIGKETELDTLLESLQVKYELATPITYQLTPQQIKSLVNDITNAWASTGNVNVKYNKDATIVINSLIARIEALENA